MRFAVSLVMVAPLGCGSMDSVDKTLSAAGTIRNEVVTTNGTDLNGTDLNGTDLNGTDLNGSRLASTLAAAHLTGAALHSSPLPSVWLEGGELRAERDGVLLSGTDLVGLVLDGELGDGRWVKVRLEGATAVGAGVWHYAFLYKPGWDAVWEAVCPQGPAVVVSGRWNYQEGVPGGGAFTADPSVFTIGCPNGAVAKCMRLGYRPWEWLGGVSGVDLHTSCVRAIRADYCGDGRSHTTDGHPINIYDGAGVQADTESWNIDAEWTPNGTRCVSALSRELFGVTCGPVLNLLACGDRSHFQTGTRQITEIQGPLTGLMTLGR